MVKDYKAKGNNVLLVDAGDTIQGTVYSYFDKGKSIIKLMNKTGYNLATPGNHEFDFGINNLKKLKNHVDYFFHKR